MKNKILVTGGTGMCGNAIKRTLEEIGNKNEFIFIGRKDCDLTNTDRVRELFHKVKPNKVIHMAARVGGVKANTDFVADFYNENILMNTNVLMVAHENNVQNLVSLSSTCIYPDEKYISYPLKESMLHLGPPHESNFGYAYAKRMLDVQSRAFRQQYGRNYVIAIPNNLYGIKDNFDLESGHVIPAIIRKVYEAKNDISKVPLTFWGNGKSLREFTYVDDIAKSLLKMVGEYGVDEVYSNENPINIGSSEEISIKGLVDLVVKIFDYKGPIVWDESKPNGQYRKNSLKNNIISLDYTPLEIGLTITCRWFSQNYPNLRGVVKNNGK